MRFLCLHGKGTSGKIFEIQSSSFRRHLPSDYTFDFVDGQYKDVAAAGIDLFFEPPYYQHYPSITASTVQDLEIAHKWLVKYVHAHGPYDGVMNFSQGCALSASLLLSQQYRGVPPLFKVAVFICGGVPMEWLSAIEVDVPIEARELNTKSAFLLSKQASSEAILINGASRWATDYDADAVIQKHDVFGFNFDEIPNDKLIQIPTVHVYGSKDPRFPAGVTLAHFCNESTRMEFNHGGGHEIPRRTDVSQEIARLIQQSVALAEEEAAGE